jgi:nicotinate-nucleotide adenylyltransferase
MARQFRRSLLQHCVHRVFSYTRRVERLGILGGTFDPVHVAHVAAATAARDDLRLDRVLVVVARDPWQKRGRVCAPADARFEMVAAALEGIDGIVASRLELDRPGPTYTVDTVDILRRETPDAAVFLVVGADVAAGLDSWRRAADLRDAVVVAIVDRDDPESGPPPGWRHVRVHMPRLDVSSTEIRRRIAADEPVADLIPASAERVLRARGLYTGRQ